MDPKKGGTWLQGASRVCIAVFVGFIGSGVKS